MSTNLKNLNFMKIRRSHDKLYLEENRYEETKEIFKFIINKSFKKIEYNKNLEICDLGCAAGEFLYYLNLIAPNSNLTGLDISNELLIKAKRHVPSANYINDSVLNKNIFNENQFDKTFLSGVHSIFDNFELCFMNIINWTKPNGIVCITGLFNPYPVDVYLKFKESKDYKSDFYEVGWNIFSQDSIGKFLSGLKKVKSYTFKEFSIGIDLNKKEDPLRSWTFKNENKKRIITNGLSIIQPLYVLKIQL